MQSRRLSALDLKLQVGLKRVGPGEATLPLEMFLDPRRRQDPTAASSSTLIALVAPLLALASYVLRRRRLAVLSSA